jgi:TonB family protein
LPRFADKIRGCQRIKETVPDMENLPILKACSVAFCVFAVCGAAFCAENGTADVPARGKAPETQVAKSKPDDEMKAIESRIKNTWHAPKVTSRMTVSVLFTIDKSGRLKSTEIKKSSGDKAVDQAAVSAVKRAQPFAPLSGDYSEFSVSYTFECRPDRKVDDYKLNGVPIKDQGYRITGGGATLRPLDTSSKAEEQLAARAQVLGDKVVALSEKLAQQEKAVGTDNPAIVTTLNELANAQKQLGHYDEADSNFKRLIALEEKVGDKQNLAASLADYGDGYYLRTQYAAAEPLLTRAIALKKELGFSGAADAAVLEEYAKLLYKLNRAPEADAIYAQIKTLRAK